MLLGYDTTGYALQTMYYANVWENKHNSATLLNVGSLQVGLGG